MAAGVLRIFSLKLSALMAIALTAASGQAVTIIGIEGASSSNITSGESPSVYGGVAGTCATDGVNTCDSCATAPGLEICNRTRIDANLQLRISFTSTVSGRPILTKSDGTTLVDLEATNVNQGQTATLSVPWGTVCGHLDNGAPNCLSSSTLSSHTFKIGIDANNSSTLDSGDDSTTIRVSVINPDPTGTGDFDQIDDCDTNADLHPGICGFLAYPGDEKIFLDDIAAGSGFPATAAGTITKVNVYTSVAGFITAPSQASPTVLDIEQTDSGFDVTNKIVDGLTNGVPHYFRVSVSDQANNEMYFTSDAGIITICGSLNPDPPFDGVGGDFCPFAAIPDDVIGFLDEDLNCFIATAAFGSPFHPFVEDFREFRDRFLKPSALGRNLVDWYYNWSPDAARWLQHHDGAKIAVRVALLPFWVLTRAMIWWPLTLALILALLGLRLRRQQVKREI